MRVRPSESPASRLRPSSTYASDADIAVAIDNVPRFPEEFARGGVEDGHGAGRRARIAVAPVPDVLASVGMPGVDGVDPGAIPHRKAGRRRGVSGDGVDEPDPSPVLVVEPAVGHLLPVRGDVGVCEHLGVADLGRLLQVGVLHGQVPGAQHRVAAAAVDQVIVRAEADAPLIEGVPPFQWPAGGGVPDDELAVGGDRPHERAVGGEPDVAHRVPVTPQRGDRRRRWPRPPGARPSAVRGPRVRAGSPAAFTSSEARKTSSRRQIRFARRHVVRRQRPAGVQGPAVRAERQRLAAAVPIGTRTGGVDGERRSQTTA